MTSQVERWQDKAKQDYAAGVFDPPAMRTWRDAYKLQYELCRRAILWTR